MLQYVLTERCNLRSHPAKREAPVYSLVPLKTGSKLRLVKTFDPDAGWDFSQKAGEVHARAVPVAALLYVLGTALPDRPIVDRTGLNGTYAFDLLWTPQEMLTAAADNDSGLIEAPRPSIFTAVQEQLGLKLQPTNAQVDALVIDHIDRPTAN